MQLYGRGIRRRLAPMLGGDRRRLEMAYSLQLALPGTPVLRYGDEIGIGMGGPAPMLTWFERILHTRRECEEIGTGEHEVIEVGNPSVLVHRATGARGTMLFLHNLGSQPCWVSLPELPDEELPPLNMAADGEYGGDVDLLSLELNGYGYRWIRLARSL